MSVEDLFGTSWPVFIGFTICIMGVCAALMGRGIARNWRPARHTLPYALLLGIADRFLICVLFGGDPFSPAGFALDEYIILIAALISYRATLAGQMARQYPWLHERVMIFGWRVRS
jgi:branched-chain amino acid transport system ATP-binding protein